MKSLLEYKNLIMATGLIPVIVCMIFCIFCPDASVLYVCSLASIVYILYRLVKPPVYQPNLVLLHGTLALIIASVMKGIGGDMLIPDRTVPITLEILILSISLLYLMVPSLYNKIFSYFHYKISILNCWAIQVIALLSSIHLFISCIIYLFFRPLSYNTLYAMTHIIPPLVYIVCILVNYVFVKTVSLTYKKMPFLRIAPICNGKIYVAPRNLQGEEPGKLDIPMEDYIYACKTDTDKYAKEVEKRYSNHINGQPEPRFSLKHLVKAASGMQKTILLYVLPLNDEDQIHFTGGKFVTPEEIEANSKQYSSFLREEVDHLNVVAQMWDEFK
ncbi:MAG: hypothetical protein LUI85_21285 [Bacteroides sp.]|nr:hypothetical protein [Bacteroides sp.]